MKNIKNIILITLVIMLVLPVTSFAQTEFDLEGRTITFVNRQYGKESGDTWLDGNYLEPNSRLEDHIKSVEERFNCNLEFRADLHEAFDVPDVLREEVLAGETNISMARTRATVLAPLAREGFIHNMSDILEEEYFERFPDYPELAESPGREVDGKLYAVSGYGSPTIGNFMLQWNKDLFETEGLPNLYDLYEDGEWTYEKFLELSRELTKDTTGDGEIDQWGTGYAGGNRFLGEVWLATNNTNLVERVDNRIELIVDQPEVITALEVWQTIVNEELLAGRDQWNAGNMGMWCDIINPQKLSEKDFENGLMFLPKGPNADEHKSPFWGGGGHIIPITEPDPRAVIEVWHALHMNIKPYLEDNPGYEVDDFSEEALREEAHRLWGLHASDKKDIEIALKQPEVTFWTAGRGDLRETDWIDIVDEIINEGANAASTTAEFKTEGQAVIDELYNQ